METREDELKALQRDQEKAGFPWKTFGKAAIVVWSIISALIIFQPLYSRPRYSKKVSQSIGVLTGNPRSGPVAIASTGNRPVTWPPTTRRTMINEKRKLRRTK